VRYFEHAKVNLVVAFKAALLCVFHVAHAFVPCRWTEHDWWGLNLTKDSGE